MGSADWMTRNLTRRVEVVTPVEDEALQKELQVRHECVFNFLSFELVNKVDLIFGVCLRGTFCGDRKCWMPVCVIGEKHGR